MKQHPNMLVGGASGTIGVIVAWLLGHFHVPLSAEDGAALSAALTALVLFVGRRGLKQTLRQIWEGQTSNWPPATSDKTGL